MIHYVGTRLALVRLALCVTNSADCGGSLRFVRTIYFVSGRFRGNDRPALSNSYGVNSRSVHPSAV